MTTFGEEFAAAFPDREIDAAKVDEFAKHIREEYVPDLDGPGGAVVAVVPPGETYLAVCARCGRGMNPGDAMCCPSTSDARDGIHVKQQSDGTWR